MGYLRSVSHATWYSHYTSFDTVSLILWGFVDRLLEIEGETIEAKHTLFRLFNYVKSLLPSPDVNVMIAASKTLGRIAEMGGTAFADQIDVEVPRALEALQSDKPEGRHAAVLILRELARHSAAHFHPHVGLVLERIWVPLRDSRVSSC